MLKLTTDQTTKLKQIILDYIHGELISVINVRLQIECATLKTSCKSLYKKVALSDKDDLLITAILNRLKIHKTTNPASNRYDKLLNKSNNLYELLENLSYDGNHQISYLLNMIGRTKPSPNWTIVWLITALSGIVLGFLIYLNRRRLNTLQAWIVRKFPIFLHWLNKTLSVVRNIPLIGIAYNTISLMLSWYNTFANGSITTIRKLQRQCFKTLTAGLNILGYTLSFLAAGVVTIPAAIFFVLGASNDIFHSIFDWYRNHKAYQKLKHYHQKPRYDEPWEVLAEYERAKNLHRRSLHSVWIRTASALLVTGAVAIWSFCPPSLIITICCVVFISLIAITSKSVIWSINETSARHLQKALKNIPLPPEDELRPKDPDHSEQIYPTEHSQHAKADLINQWEKSFLQTEDQNTHTYQSTAVVLLGLNRANPPSTHPEDSHLVSTFENKPKESDRLPDPIDFNVNNYLTLT